MSDARDLLDDPRLQAAITELQDMIRQRYPDASFTVGCEEDPEGVYLRAMVDVIDRGEVIDVFIDRLVELQLEEQLPIYVIPVRPPERTAALLRAQRALASPIAAAAASGRGLG